jgi:hypothetical protein
MSIDHNRIKIADLEKNQPNKILTTNTDGELEFSNINNISYNALDYTITGKALDARQGKILKNLIENINDLLASDNINLNTLQKLVDAIETVQNSLSTILVNDLTSGGTSKGLTAEMGKTLKTLIDSLGTNKVDKVVGERLINKAEQIKLAEIQIGVEDLLEEKINGTAVENLSMAGNMNIDFNSYVHGKFTLTGNTIWTFTNTPALGRSITRTYEVNSTITQSLSITNAIRNFGTYLADSSVNFITVVASNTTYSGLKINVFFNS